MIEICGQFNGGKINAAADLPAQDAKDAVRSKPVASSEVVEPDSKSKTTKAIKPYFFVVAADPQLLYKQKDDRNWRTTIGHINRIKPDFMIVCGDLVQAPNESVEWEDPKKVAEFDKLAALYTAGAKRLNPAIKLYNVAGNHDVSLTPTPRTLSWYESRFNTKPWYNFVHKNSLFVVLESNLLRNPKGAPKHAIAQKQFIDQSIKLAKQKPFAHRTVYMHHPLCINAIDEKDQYFNMPSKVRLALIRRFKEAGFVAAFCGHLHRNAYVKTGNFEIITTSSCGAALGKDPLGFRIVKVYPDRLEHKFVPFGKVPEKVELKQGR